MEKSTLNIEAVLFYRSSSSTVTWSSTYTTVSTRKWWVADVLEKILEQPVEDTTLPSRGFQTVIKVLMDRADSTENDPNRDAALNELNMTLAREGFQAFYAEDNCCYIRNLKTGNVGQPDSVVGRALSKDEIERRRRLENFMDSASEDELTEKVIFPLLQTLGFQRISITGHIDKAMEFGKDLWMKYRLPTGHWLYFGLQVKRGKIDSAARTKNENVAEIHNQILMMLVLFQFNSDRLTCHRPGAVWSGPCPHQTSS